MRQDWREWGWQSLFQRLWNRYFVLATDRSRPNIERAKASASLNGTFALHCELFDVTLPRPLPSRSSPVFGNLRSPLYTPECSHELPALFDYLVFSDVLYWPKEAAAFGRRAGEAYAAGTTVIIGDPGRRREDFLAALREELINRNCAFAGVAFGTCRNSRACL